ncbi:hypothetical protein J6590_066083 [Homalodisca vitripennis]|nr:hypothetical protein J6590_066083 [Homalodisca vitripennis]
MQPLLYPVIYIEIVLTMRYILKQIRSEVNGTVLHRREVLVERLCHEESGPTTSLAFGDDHNEVLIPKYGQHLLRRSGGQTPPPPMFT